MVAITQCHRFVSNLPGHTHGARIPPGMTKKTTRQLTLRTSTLKPLSPTALTAIDGGQEYYTTGYNSCSCGPPHTWGPGCTWVTAHCH